MKKTQLRHQQCRMEKERPKEVAKTKEVTLARTTQERQLAGKVAIVTGGSRGIGAAIANRLAGDGTSVAVT